MPRSGWLATGGAAASLALSGEVTLAAVLAVAGVALGLVAFGVRRSPGGGPGGSGARGRFVAAAAGVLAVALRVGLQLGPGIPAASAIPMGVGPWSATVVAVGSPLDGQQRATLRLEISGTPLVAASLPRYPAVEPGDRARVGGAVRPPGDDAYGAYLARIGIVGTLRSSTLDALEPSTDPAWLLERLRRASGEALARTIPQPEAGLAAGILVGLRDLVDRDLAADFTTAGVSHVVAISGWNIAIVGALVAALAGGLSRRRRSALTLAAITAYVAFAGASSSVLRAALMAAVVLLARETGRAGRAAAVLGWAAALLLILDPRLVLDPGLQLSTLATAGLIAWSTSLTARLAGPSPGRLRRWLAESLGVSLAAQAATLPIVLATFGRLSIVAPLVNLAVVPLVAPAMAVGGLALVAGWLVMAGLPDVLGVILGLPAWALLGVMVGLVRAGAALPFASVTIEPPWSVVAGALAGLSVLAATGTWRRSVSGPGSGPGRALRRLRLLAVAAWPFVGRRPVSRSAGGTPMPRSGAGPSRAGRPGHASGPGRQSRLLRISGGVLVGAMLSLGVVAARVPDGATRVVILDVGQGDAILVEGSRGARLLVDTGPDPDRLLVALDERLPPWDHRLDAVLISHPHEDHVAGLALLLERYRVGRVLDPGMSGPGPGYAAADKALAGRHVPRGTLAGGDVITVDDLVLHVLWPDAGSVPRQPADSGVGINNVSVVLLGEVNGSRFLLTGDAEQAVDGQLVARDLPPVDLLKVAHHGSATATTDGLLAAVRPALAVISVGTGNTYGHPAPSTLSRLRAHGVPVLRTDLDGEVEVTFRAGRVSAKSARGGGWSPGVGYHRADDRAFASGRRPLAALPESAALVRATRPRRGGGERLARRTDGPGRDARGSPARRGRRAAPRRRQAPPAGRSRPPPRPR